MGAVFGSETLNVKYVSQPGLKGQGDSSIITFNVDGGSQGNSTSTALLMDNVVIDFRRGFSRQYFLNDDGVGYLMGMGQGTLRVSGLLGSAANFNSVFGTDSDKPCNNKFTVTLNVKGLATCNTDTGEAGSREAAGAVKLSGVVPTAVTITTQIQQDGVLYYKAEATFQFSKMEMLDSNGSSNSKVGN